MKTLTLLEKSKDFWFVLSVSFIFFIFRFPSLFEPYWYGDEGIYQVIGSAIREGRGLYTEIWDNKPPLLYLLYALFSSDQFTIRAVSMVFGVASIISFFFLSKKIFSLHRVSYITTLFYALLFGLPIIEGNIANAENFMLFPIILAAYIAFLVANKKIERRRYTRLLFSCGLLLSVAFLFKIVAIFDFLAFSIFLLFLTLPTKTKLSALKRQVNHSLSLLVPLFLGFFVPIALTIFYFWVKGAFWDFFQASFTQNVGYVGHGNTFLVAQGLLYIKLILLIAAVFFLFSKRNNVSSSTLFILLWFSFSLFNALFSARPYIHYLLVLLPSFTLFLGLLFWDKKYQKIILVLSIVVLVVITKNFGLYKKGVSYYQNFISYMLNTKSTAGYLNFFDRKTSRNYEIAQYVKSRSSQNDSVFLWGNTAQLYTLIEKLPPGRFIVAYHITASQKSLQETKDALERTKPKYVIVESNPTNIPYALADYTQKITINDATIYERIF